MVRWDTVGRTTGLPFSYPLATVYPTTVARCVCFRPDFDAVQAPQGPSEAAYRTVRGRVLWGDGACVGDSG